MFQTEIRNARVTEPTLTPSFIGETRIRGVELNVSGTILPGWTVFGGYTYPRPEDRRRRLHDADRARRWARRPPSRWRSSSVNTGKQVPQTARNSFTATTNVDGDEAAPDRRHRALHRSRSIGGYADNRTATQNAAGVVTVIPATKTLYRADPRLLAVRCARELSADRRRSTLSVNAQNLTDKTYFTQAYTSHYATIAAGRTVFGTIGVSF